MDEILQVNGLKTSFLNSNGETQAVRGLSFTVHKGEALGIVGESGSGKSVTSMSILQLLASTGRIREGEVLFEGKDLTKATRFCLGRGWRRLAYLGATGKREDHTLGNISLLVRYMREMDVLPAMITDYGYFTPAQGRQLFQSFPGQQVSIFNYGCRTLGSQGLRWESYPYQMAWQGTLNESAGDSFTLTGDGDYLVFRTFEAKT